MAGRSSERIITAGIITDSMMKAGMLLPGHSLLSLTVVRSSVSNGGCYIIFGKGIYSKNFKVYRSLGFCFICETVQTWNTSERAKGKREINECLFFRFKVYLQTACHAELPLQAIVCSPTQHITLNIVKLYHLPLSRKQLGRTNLGSAVFLKKNP